ncbi:unnamed protein product [Brassica oleracea var. botrytis]
MFSSLMLCLFFFFFGVIGYNGAGNVRGIFLDLCEVKGEMNLDKDYFKNMGYIILKVGRSQSLK